MIGLKESLKIYEQLLLETLPWELLTIVAG
jgi:hypothetical protein